MSETGCVARAIFCVRVNFRCQFDLDIGIPDIWSIIILKVSMMVFWGNINI